MPFPENTIFRSESFLRYAPGLYWKITIQPYIHTENRSLVSLNIICFSSIVKKASSLFKSLSSSLPRTNQSYVETWLWPSNPRSLGREADTLTTRPPCPLLVVQVYSAEFVKCFDIVHFESVQSIVNNNIFTVLNVFFKALNSRFCQVSQSFDYKICQIVWQKYM